MSNNLVSQDSIQFLNECTERDAVVLNKNDSACRTRVNADKSIHLPNHYARSMSLHSWSPMINIREESFIMSRNELLLLMFAFANIKKHDDHFEPILLPLVDLCRMLGVKLGGSTDYHAWDKTITKLGLRGMVYVEGGKRITTRPYFSTCTLDTEENTVFMKLNPDLAPYFLHLEKNKTIFNFGYLRQLSSANVISLYIMCASMKKGDYDFIVDLAHWKKMLGYNGENKYFLSEVLIPGLYEINKVTDLTVHIQYIRKGRSIDAVRCVLDPKSVEMMKEMNISPMHEKRAKIKKVASEMRKSVMMPIEAEVINKKEIHIGGDVNGKT